MPSHDKKLYHFLFTPLPLWGHTRAPCILAARTVKEHDNLVITIIVSPSYLKNAEAEITAEFADSEVSQSTRHRVRILSTYKPETNDFFAHIFSMFQTYPIAYKTLLEAKPVACAVAGTVFNAVAAPVVVFLDVYASPLMQATRAISGSTIPIVAFCPVHVSFLVHLYGPEHMDGHGDLAAKIEAEAARRGVTAKEIGDTIFYHTEGRVTKVPGLPPMYDWEHFPQTLHTTPTVSDFLKLAYAGFTTCDAVFSLSSYDFEQESIDAMKSWFADEWKKEVYTIGPLVPSKPTTYGMVSDQNATSSDIEAFLDRSLKEHGEKSLVLISFGSLFWPIVPEYIEEVLEALIEKKFPFIVSYASHFAKISEELIARIKSTRSGLICKWLPQKFVLNHPATGWFVTHAGQSGVLESLDSGVPMICWPFEFDQPLASAHLSENMNIAFELVEVRTGENGMKPLRRHGKQAKGTREAVGVEIREVLDACRGEKGAELRKNAEEMKAKFAKSWKPEGVSRKNFNEFLEKYDIHLS